MKENCGNCKFYKRLNEQEGICVRYPLMPRGSSSEPNPVVSNVSWCGEWASRNIVMGD